MLSQSIIQEIENLIPDNNPILDMLAKSLGLKKYHQKPKEGNIIYDMAGLPIHCKLCNATDKWILEDGRIWVCEHTGEKEEWQLPIRVLDSVKIDECYIKNCLQI